MALNLSLLDVKDFEDDKIVHNKKAMVSDGRRGHFVHHLKERLKTKMDRLSFRIFFMLCLFVIAIATMHLVRTAGDDFKALELILRSLPSSSVASRQNSFAAPQVHNYRNYPWTFKCIDSKCQRQLAKRDGLKVSFDVCWLTCGKSGPIWPVPRKIKFRNTTAAFYSKNFFIRDITGPSDTIKSLVNSAASITRYKIVQMFPEDSGHIRRSIDEDVRHHSPDSTIIEVHISVDEARTSITEYTDESYQMNISSVSMGTGALVKVIIKAATFFGARHGLESMSQLAAFDEPNQCLRIVDEVCIEDGPAYPVRGLMIDTARNYMPIDSISRMIDAMSYSKMNVLHWHISDSDSFPFESRSIPEMSQFGAYNPVKVYSIEKIKDLVQYALIRGIKIIPELDAPAHAGTASYFDVPNTSIVNAVLRAGNGWQWGRQRGYGDLAVCVGKEPWRSYCGQPPCGQLNPINPNVYRILEQLYEELLVAFNTDTFHMGGDEVLPMCWDQIPGIQEWKQDHHISSHLELWGVFQEKAYESLQKAHKGNPIEAIVWSSGLTESPVGRRYLPPKKFIVQIWEPSTSRQIHDLLAANYKVIFSNLDSMYLDRGGGTWLGGDHDYSYFNWQKLYDNDLDTIVVNALSDKSAADKHSKQVLGGIATLWSEKVDENNMDVKLWPRGAAAAERLWTNPKTVRDDTVYARLNHHTKRLKSRGVRCSTLQPESCLQMTGNCDDPQTVM